LLLLLRLLVLQARSIEWIDRFFFYFLSVPLEGEDARQSETDDRRSLVRSRGWLVERTGSSWWVTGYGGGCLAVRSASVGAIDIYLLRREVSVGTSVPATDKTRRGAARRCVALR
jgi:hypothetical protein